MKTIIHKIAWWYGEKEWLTFVMSVLLGVVCGILMIKNLLWVAIVLFVVYPTSVGILLLHIYVKDKMNKKFPKQ